MLSYELLHVLPIFDKSDFAMLNLDNVIHQDRSQQIMNQLNSHIEAIKNINNHKKIFDKKEFAQKIKLNHHYDNDLLNERYRLDRLGYKDMRKLDDHYYRFHKSIASKPESDLIDYYSHLEDSYYTKLYLLFNTDL